MSSKRSTEDGGQVSTRTDAAVPEDSFLSRWSRRKLELRREQPPAPGSESDPPPGRGGPSEDRDDFPADADMPPLESLDADSDYSGFLSPKVSEVLRKAALRKLFHQPACNVTDGLDDYAEDFTAFKGLGQVVTHEMKRMLRREQELAREADGEGRQSPAPEGQPAEAVADSPPADPDGGEGPAPASAVSDEDVKKHV